MGQSRMQVCDCSGLMLNPQRAGQLCTTGQAPRRVCLPLPPWPQDPKSQATAVCPDHVAWAGSTQGREGGWDGADTREHGCARVHQRPSRRLRQHGAEARTAVCTEPAFDSSAHHWDGPAHQPCGQVSALPQAERCPPTPRQVVGLLGHRHAYRHAQAQTLVPLASGRVWVG